MSGLDGRLPFSLDDASRPDNEKDENPDAQFNRVLLDTRLNNRVVDLRVRQLTITLRLSKPNTIGIRLRRIRLSLGYSRPLGPSLGSIWTPRAS